METADNDEFYLFEPGEIEQIIDKGRSALRELAATQVKNGAPRSAFRIPPPLSSDYRWAAPGECVTIGKYTITAGLFYVGTSMRLVNGASVAALVNPALPFPQKYKTAPHGGKTPEDYDYAKLTPLQRREYLAWLAGGRNDPDANGWNLMLFLTGLERRVIEDGRRGLVSVEERRLIRDETARLLALYGQRNDTPAFTLARFFCFMELNLAERKLYTLPVLPEQAGRDASLYLTALVNQCAEDKVPINAETAFAWYLCGSNGNMPLLFYCYAEYKALFLHYFDESYKDKVLVTQGKESYNLKPLYKPLSDQVRSSEIALPHALHAISSEPLTEAAADIENQCLRQLERYTLFRASDEPDKRRARFVKPFFFWDEAAKESARALAAEVKERKTIDCEVGWFFDRIDENIPFSLDIAGDLVHGLEALGISSTLDAQSALDERIDEKTIITLYPFTGALAPASKDLFQFQLQMLRLVAAAAAECIPEEYPQCYPGCLSGSSTSDYQHKKLSNTLFLMHGNKAVFKEIVKPFTRMPQSIKYSLVQIINHFFDLYRQDCQYDVGYKGIAFLEKLYAALKIDKAELYSRLHKEAAGETEKPETAAFSLDKEKIKKLRRDTDAVSEILSAVFVDGETETETAAARDEAPSALEGLDRQHSLFIEKLLEKTRWTREEAAALAETSSLILDGAIEILNEAAFEQHDDMLIEDEGDELILNETIRDYIIQEMKNRNTKNKRKEKRHS